MMPELDAVVVGAGPAGSSAALVMARAGLRVAVLERGETPGSKNVSGGVLHSYALRRLLPDRWQEAPLERRISRYTASLLSDAGAVAVDYQKCGDDRDAAPAFSVVRPRFDAWLAERAVEAGALLVPETVADDLLWDGSQVIGVRARRAEGEVRAKVVIAADGVNSVLVQKAGLRADWRPSQVGLGLKETLRLPAEAIQERFGLGAGDGAAMTFVGGLPAGVRGGGFLYTNRDSLSVGIVIQPDSNVASGVPSIDVLDAFKAHPAVRRWLRGGAAVEYSAHLVPEGGAPSLARLCNDGLMAVGDAAGLVLNTGFSVEGMSYAIASGAAAGETAVEAIRRGNVGRAALGAYRNRLEATGMLGTFRRFGRVPELLGNPRLYAAYPSAAVATAERWFAIDERPRRRFLAAARETGRGHVGLRRLLSDGIRVWRALLWP